MAPFRSLTQILKPIVQVLRQLIQRLVMGVVTILRHPNNLNRLVIFTIGWFVVGLMAFHIKADFTTKIWADCYYTWDKGRDLLFFLILYRSFPKFRRLISLIIVYAIVRLCFQIVSSVTKMDTNDQRTVNTLYLILLGIFIYQSIKELKNEWHRD